jgi:hypothetical protein
MKKRLRNAGKEGRPEKRLRDRNKKRPRWEMPEEIAGLTSKVSRRRLFQK